MKFINSYFDKTKGTSKVELKHLNRTFIGTAKTLPEDFNHCSEFYGCELAEMKAEMKAYVYELKLAKREYRIVKKLIAACEYNKRFDKESSSAKVVYRQKNIIAKKVIRLENKIDKLDFEYRQKIKMYDKQVERLDKIRK